jgi:hypothetical protein
VIGGGVTGVVLATTGGDKKDKVAQSCKLSSSAPATGSSLRAAPSSDGAAPSEADARAVAECYFADINKRDQKHAETLICSQARDQWKRTVDGTGGDFTVTVDSFTFSKSAAGSQPNSTDVTYQIHVSKGGQHRSSDLTFTVINESGPKICDES